MVQIMYYIKTNATYSEKLDKIDIVSGNYYPTMKGGMLKPCEMSDAKVIDFVLHASVL